MEGLVFSLRRSTIEPVKEDDSFLTRLKVSPPARAFAHRAVCWLDAREQTGKPGGAWHRPDGVWALERAGLLSALPEKELAAVGVVRTFARGNVLVLDESETGVWIVLEGGLKLCRTGVLGQRLIEAMLERGDIFGRLTPSTESARYEVHALERGRAVAVRRARFEALLQAHPELAYAVVGELESRQRALTRRLESLVFKDVHMRVAETLLDLMREHGTPCVHGFAVDVRVTQQDIADLVGASRQMVSRVLKDFERRLYLQRVGRIICVLHRERLRRFAEGTATKSDDV